MSWISYRFPRVSTSFHQTKGYHTSQRSPKKRDLQSTTTISLVDKGVVGGQTLNPASQKDLIETHCNAVVAREVNSVVIA